MPPVEQFGQLHFHIVCPATLALTGASSPACVCSELQQAGGSYTGLSPQLQQMAVSKFGRFLAACLSDCIFADLGWAELRPFDV